MPASLAAVVPVFMATPDVGLGQGRRVVGPVAGHGDELPALLLGLDQRHLGLGGGLGQEVVDAGLLGDGRRGQGIVSGDHDSPDAHLAHLVELLSDALLDHVLQLDDSENARSVGHCQWGRPGPGDPLHDGVEVGGDGARPARSPIV